MRRWLHAFCTFFVFLASNAADFENRADGMTDAVGIRVQMPPGRLVLRIFCVLSTRFLLPILREIVVFRQFPRAFSCHHARFVFVRGLRRS